MEQAYTLKPKQYLTSYEKNVWQTNNNWIPNKNNQK